MKLFSTFKDYYDTSIAYGIDEQCFFDRQPRTDTNVKPVTDIIDGLKSSRYFLPVYRHFNLSWKVFFFCGNAYLRVKFTQGSENPYFVNDDDICQIAWSLEELDNMIEKLSNMKTCRTDFSNYDVKHSQGKYAGSSMTLRDYYKNLFDLVDKIPHSKILELHNLYDSPYFHLSNSSYEYNDQRVVLINPCLKDLQFQKTKEATQAFQEISQFISGVMGGRNPAMVKLADKELIKKRGFDRMSFRKPPSKRKVE